MSCSRENVHCVLAIRRVVCLFWSLAVKLSFLTTRRAKEARKRAFRSRKKIKRKQEKEQKIYWTDQNASLTSLLRAVASSAKEGSPTLISSAEMFRKATDAYAFAGMWNGNVTESSLGRNPDLTKPVRRAGQPRPCESVSVGSNAWRWNKYGGEVSSAVESCWLWSVDKIRRTAWSRRRKKSDNGEKKNKKETAKSGTRKPRKHASNNKQEQAEQNVKDGSMLCQGAHVIVHTIEKKKPKISTSL